MPAYHSKFEGSCEEACGCGLLPLKTKTRGPAPPCAPSDEDIVDETIRYFRPNSLFRNFEVKGSADRTLIYLTLTLQQILKECERFKTRPEAEKAVHSLVVKQFPIPGGPGWSLGGMFPIPKDLQEGETWRLYMKQAREEVASRTLDILFYPDGTKNKWWNAFAKRKFMNKELK
ncbi:hypothetical protein CTAYLR_000019 [Chrysophaeum taylorii]|uniref:Actin-related protein 2/3 complex subunit 3 n=1 Tax=Chrysophaeum taylorii TaxID=2483200 RepID=A0AAD7UGL9_9STRA|nr:hypothetical protein CTAYLR_000019 [Chrysophaeum taylorii]